MNADRSLRQVRPLCVMSPFGGGTASTSRNRGVSGAVARPLGCKVLMQLIGWRGLQNTGEGGRTLFSFWDE